MKTTVRSAFEKICSLIHGKCVLYVGVADYSKDCAILDKDNWLISIDKQISEMKFGARKHYVMDLTKLDFPDNYFDVVFMLGVVGYGLDKPEDIFKAFEQVKRVLKPDGSVIFTVTKK